MNSHFTIKNWHLCSPEYKKDQYNAYCLPPIFPEMWRLFLESAPSMNASGVMTYFQPIVEIVHTLSLDCGMTETGGDDGNRNMLDRAGGSDLHILCEGSSLC